MNGKAKCEILKQIRRDIAAKNDISITISECRHQGNCLGTCPKCEAEVSELEKALELRRKKGKQVVLAGILAGLIAANCAACTNPFERELTLEGDMAVETETDSAEQEITLQGDILEPPEATMGEMPEDTTE